MVFGDFDEILNNNVKFYGVLRPMYHMRNLKQALDECILRDLWYNGYIFMWEKFDGLDRKACLDRSVVKGL